MKKRFLGLFILSVILAGCASSNEEKQVLKVYNWGEYIDRDVITEFEQKFNATVIYDNYDTNELMYTKIQGGEAYDILVPTDHMVERLIAEGLVQKLDLSKIPNISNVYPDLLNRPFDPNNQYSIPYLWGNIGIIYNTNNVDLADLESEGWGILANPKYIDNIYIYDSSRDVFMMAEKHLGYSVNTTDETEIENAYQFLKTIDATTNPIYIDETVIDAMVNGEKDIAVDFSGDAAYILSQNPDMSFYVPSEGTNVWMDSMVIPTNAPNPDLAHEWMNFIMGNDVATRITEYVGYTSPNKVAFETVTGPGGTYEGNVAYSPRMDNPNDEVYRYNDALKSILADKWTRVKAE